MLCYEYQFTSLEIHYHFIKSFRDSPFDYVMVFQNQHLLDVLYFKLQDNNKDININVVHMYDKIVLYLSSSVVCNTKLLNSQCKFTKHGG